MSRTTLILAATGVLVLMAGWVVANPGGRFGMSRDGLTTYDRLPFPFVDMQVRSDGAMRLVSKSHRIATQQLAWLARPQPEVLIIAAGWQGDVRGPARLGDLERTRIVALPTPRALALFNSLRDQGVRVAIHVHSTC